MNQPSTSNNLSAIILAAGQSRRTSPENKLLLSFHGRTIMQTVLDEIMPLDFTEILVVTGFEKKKIIGALRNYPVKFVFNPEYTRGMSTSIKAGISEAKTGTDGFIIFLGDMPWIDHVFIESQIQSFYTNPKSAIVIPVFQKRQGNPVIFARKYKNELLGLSDDSGARPIIEKFEVNVIEVQTQNERLLMDIDTWADYEN
jgi:molybdenum cofactor cytidylyltransferase